MFKVKHHKVKIHNQALSMWSPHHKQEEFNVSFHMQKCVEEKPQNSDNFKEFEYVYHN